MYLDDIEKRITHIQENIKMTTAKMQDLTKDLQEATLYLSSLRGHLNECLHWKSQIDLQASHENESNLVQE